MITQVSIVMLGGFNPLIFHPSWFDRYKILPLQETEWALGNEPATKEFSIDKDHKFMVSQTPPVIVQNNVADISFRSVRLNTTTEKFVLSILPGGDIQLLKETIIKIFTILPHTPVKAIGFNFRGSMRYKQDANVILRNLFSRSADIFSTTLGENYGIFGTLLYESGEAKVKLDIRNSEKMENGISCSSNYHRDVSGSALEALDVIRMHFVDDHKKNIKTIRGLLGKEVEAWKPPAL